MTEFARRQMAAHIQMTAFDAAKTGVRGATVSPKVLAVGLEELSTRQGGLNRYFAKLIEGLEALGVPIAGLVTGDVQAEPVESVIEVVASARTTLFARLRAIASAARQQADADVVDVHFALTAMPLFFGPLRRRPLVVHFHGPWADESASNGERSLTCTTKRALERFVYQRADACIVLSRSFRRMLVERYGVHPWDVHVIPPGVDLRRFSPADPTAARAALGLRDDAFIVLAVRRLIPRMGLDVLLRAWQELIRTSEAAVLCIVGTGPEQEALKELGRELGLGDSLRFAGRVEEAELVCYYQAADVSVVPSVALEGFGLVVLESLATGTPVIASALGGLVETLNDLAPDLLVPAGDPHALAERLSDAKDGSRPQRKGA